MQTFSLNSPETPAFMRPVERSPYTYIVLPKADNEVPWTDDISSAYLDKCGWLYLTTVLDTKHIALRSVLH